MNKKNMVGALVAVILFGLVGMAGAVNKYILKPDGANAAPCTVFGSPNNGMSCGKTTAPNATLDVAGGIAHYSRTIAQLQAIVPGAVGVVYYCSNCSPAKLVVSTGTSAGNFADAVGGAFQ
jgi:hypothetical protein